MTQLPLIFRALADPSRLRIVNILSYHGICVCDLQTVLGLSQPFISRHLAYLRKVGLVQGQREGAESVIPSHSTPHLLRSCSLSLREAIRLSPDFQADVNKLIECRASGRLKSYFVNSEELNLRAA